MAAVLSPLGTGAPSPAEPLRSRGWRPEEKGPDTAWRSPGGKEGPGTSPGWGPGEAGILGRGPRKDITEIPLCSRSWPPSSNTKRILSRGPVALHVTAASLGEDTEDGAIPPAEDSLQVRR